MKKILFLCFGLVVSVSLTAQLPERNTGNLKKYKATESLDLISALTGN